MREGGFLDLFLRIVVRYCQCPFCFYILTAFSFRYCGHSFQYLPPDGINAAKEVTVPP